MRNGNKFSNDRTSSFLLIFANFFLSKSKFLSIIWYFGQKRNFSEIIKIFVKKYEFWNTKKIPASVFSKTAQCIAMLSTWSLFYPFFRFCSKIRFLTKIPIFEQNSNFCVKFKFLTKNSIFDHNFDFKLLYIFRQFFRVHYNWKIL